MDRFYTKIKFKKIKGLLLLIFLPMILVLTGINTLMIFRQGDEVMHIQTVRESIEKSSYFIPHLTNVPNAYKPPLLFWLGIIGEKIFGKNLFADRIFIGILAILSMFIIFKIIFLITNNYKYAYIGGLLFITSFGIFKFSKLLMNEIPMVFFICLVLLLIIKKNYAFAGLFSGLAFMLKGPIFHVYMLIIFFNYLILFLWRPNIICNYKQFTKKIYKLSKKWILFFLISLIIPLLWVFSLIITNHNDIIWFFFINENLGKFYTENQSVFNILWGIFIYFIPYSSGIIFTIFCFILNHKIKSKTDFYISWFLLSGISFWIFHLYPDRKDPYYVLPSIPLVLCSISMLFYRNYYIEKKFININIIQSIIVILILIFLLSFVSFNILVFIGLIILMLLYLILYFNVLKRYKLHIFFLLNIMLFLYIQIILLPYYYRPIFPAYLKNELVNKKVCLVSNNYWDLFEFNINFNNKFNVIHVSPNIIYKCIEQKRDLIILDGNLHNQDNYILKYEWYTWNYNLRFTYKNLKEILIDKPIYKRMQYYEYK